MLFLSTLSLRRATRLPTALRTPHQRFLSTLSLRRATKATRQNTQTCHISIHALLAESDSASYNYHSVRPISIHALLAESDCGPAGGRTNSTPISIHALLAESDIVSQVRVRAETHFYPRSPCGERLSRANRLRRLSPFLSTLSLRRATKVSVIVPSGSLYFYPRSPCGERLV